MADGGLVASYMPGKSAWVMACGYGLHLAWISCLFYQGGLFGAIGSGPLYYGYYLASMCSLVVALLAFAYFGRPGRREPFVVSDGRASLAFAALVLVGTLLVRASGLGDAAHVAVFALSAALTGAGSAYINVLWGRQLVRHVEAQTIVVLCLAYALSAFLYYAIVHLPSVPFLVLVSCLPVASTLLALCSDGGFGRVARRGAREGSADAGGFNAGGPADPSCPAGSAEAAEPAPTASAVDEYTAKDLRFFAWRLLVATLLFGGVLGVVEAFTKSGEFRRDAVEHATLFLVALNVPLVLAAVYMQSSRLQSSRAERLVLIYRVALLAMVAALLVSGVMDASNIVLVVTMLTGYTVFKILCWTEFCQVARASGASPVFVFGVGEGCMAASLLMGNALTQALSRCVAFGDGTLRAVTAACAMLLLVTYLFVLTERQIIAIEEINEVKREKVTHFRFQERVDALARESGLTKREAEVLRLFVRGRSTSRIAEDLYISSGTVATHLRSVYRKLGVHSRQEVLDRLDMSEASGGSACDAAGASD